MLVTESFQLPKSDSTHTTPRWVVCGILENHKGDVFIVQRPAGKPLAGFWEFPGGKVEENEMPVKALIREMNEELGITVISRDITPFTFIESEQMVLLAYRVHRWSGEITLRENQPCFIWARKWDLNQYQMPRMNEPICRWLFETRRRRS